MFIYKYMSGLVNYDEGGEDDDNYDPHEHRVIEKPTSYLDTMMHMLKGSIGAGILAMPEAFKRTGIYYGIGILIFIGCFATWSIQILINTQYRLCKRYKRGYMAYPKCMKVALQDGPACSRWAAQLSYYFVDIVMITYQLGLCVVYFVFVATNLTSVLSQYGTLVNVRVMLAYLLLPMILVNLVRDLKLMTPVSSLANLVTFIGLLLVAFYLIEKDIVLEPEMTQCKDIMEIPIFIGTALFALEAVGVVLALEYNMEHPKQFTGICGLFNIGMALIVSLYLLLGIFGYLTYGNAIQASITLNLPPKDKKAQAARIIFTLAIFLTFPIQNVVPYKILWSKCKKRIPEQFRGRRIAVDYSLRVGLVVLPWTLAICIPQLGPFISLFGAFCLSQLGIIFPALMDLACCHKERRKYGCLHYKLYRDVIMILIGLFCCISGCYTSILEIIKDFKYILFYLNFFSTLFKHNAPAQGHGFCRC